MQGVVGGCDPAVEAEWMRGVCRGEGDAAAMAATGIGLEHRWVPGQVRPPTIARGPRACTGQRSRLPRPPDCRNLGVSCLPGKNRCVTVSYWPWRLPPGCHWRRMPRRPRRSEEHTSELQSLMRISYAVFCLKKKTYT